MLAGVRRKLLLRGTCSAPRPNLNAPPHPLAPSTDTAAHVDLMVKRPNFA